MSNNCNGICLRFRLSSNSGFSVGTRQNRLHPYYDLNCKYCVVCNCMIDMCSWQNFRKPTTCECCGVKLRGRPAGELKREVRRY